mmetsp:Transcript_15196/g.17361  ORF Transcript_15196/g.17361 Transcript_15196/m.17361 type:complete len:208 (-) Transcript_15196:51-674(-)
MMQSLIRKTIPLCNKAGRAAQNNYVPNHSFSTMAKDTRVGPGVPREEMPFHHFRVPYKGSSDGSSNTPKVKFQSPRKRANKMFALVQEEAMRKAKKEKPNVHSVHFRVGDAIELTMIAQGGVNSIQTEKIRGVVLGMDKRGLGTGMYLRDVVFGEPIDRKIPLYSPLIKDIKLLEENFVFKKKRKVKRAKLYYLRDRLPQETRVTKW